ncbi:MAG: hypothetical protein JSU86_04485, partial [Phycisphaerales bacterium]
MRPVLVSSIAVLVTACASLAQTPHELSSKSNERRKTCDTTYDGPLGGSFYAADNWTNGLPSRDQVACLPDDQRRVGSLNPSEPQAGGSDDPPYASNPPPPPASGSCCLGSTCMETDAFDCRELDGYFLEGVGPCSEFVCDTGVCCKQDAECLDDDGAGGQMDQDLCDIVVGNYLGGGRCDDTDPCQRYRIPEGYEIIDVSSGTVVHSKPRINNCGQIVFHIGPSYEDIMEVFLYDNRSLGAVTANSVPDAWPSINDEGAITWTRDADGLGGGQVVLLEDGELTALGEGSLPSINNLGHVAWQRFRPEPPAFRSEIFFYDGSTVRAIFDDGLSNQSVRINDYDEMTWARADFTGGGGYGGWTSDIMRYADSSAAALPSSQDTPDLPDIDNIGRVAWGHHGVEVWEEGTTTFLCTEPQARIPALNNRGDIVYQSMTDITPYQLWLYRDDQFYRISNDIDVENHFDNSRSALNDAGEIAWWWKPNGGSSPSGIRLMRRIRNGDVDFDGDRDLDDFAPMPGCWTGPVVTDGLCECRFFDIDHDRDIDYDDLDLFMRVYTGPLDDCNQNEILDLHDLIEGTSKDCNLSGTPDECDLSAGSSQDLDGDGLLDECCMPSAPAQGDTLGTKNRYLSFTAGDSGQPLAIRVTFTDLPASFEALEGQTMWVGRPREYCENAGQGPSTLPEDCMPVAGRISRTFLASTLECQPYYT